METGRSHKVIQPDGKEGSYATIDIIEGVSVLPIDDEGNAYITRQFRYALGRKNLETIAGGINDGEPLENAKREAKEELGIEAEEWISLGKIEGITSITNNTTHLFIARGLTVSKPDSEGTEEIEPVKMKLSELTDKVLSGEITHSETSVLVLKAVMRK
ncbi:MAG: NUDIX hydrolase [Pyrinomonadaceae bacterium]